MTAAIPFIAKAVLGAVVSAGVSKVIGGKPKSGGAGAVDNSALLAAQRRQEENLAQQEAVVKRQQVAADAREAELDKDLASQRRAVIARRSSRGQLAFSGSKLKSTLGG